MFKLCCCALISQGDHFLSTNGFKVVAQILSIVMPKFHLYVVHTAQFVQRPLRLHGTIQTIREAASQNGYEFRSIFVLNPDPNMLQPKLQQLSDRIKYDKTGYDLLDASSTVLNLEALSNYEKHREVWRRILAEVKDANDLCMVIEDDAVMIPEMQKPLQQFFANPRAAEWDFYSLSVSIPSNAPRELLSIADHLRVLPSKCAYAVRADPRILQRFLDETEIIRFSMRGQLAYIFLKHRDVRAVVSSSQCIMEGSKIGFFPSTIHPNNMHIFNQEYMELFNMLQSPTLSEAKATAIYQRVQQLQSPDLLHIYGVILFKCGLVKEAAQILSTAVDWMHKQHGMVNSGSDVLNNAINMYEHMQWDLPEYFAQPSKYDNIIKVSSSE